MSNISRIVGHDTQFRRILDYSMTKSMASSILTFSNPTPLNLMVNLQRTFQDVTHVASPVGSNLTHLTSHASKNLLLNYENNPNTNKL